MRKIALVIVAVTVVAAACGDDAHDEPRTVPIGAADGGSIIQVAVGDELVLDLEATPSTGYTWVDESAASTALVALGGPEFIEQSDLIGAAGIMRCRFEAIDVGTAELELAYRRPWETDVEPERWFTVTVVVK